MSRPVNASGPRTRQAILDAALSLFADKGYFGTTLRDVASAVGVRESALYNYFPGKEALFEAILAAESGGRSELVTAMIEDPSFDVRARLEEFAEFVLDRFVQPRQEQLFRVLMADGIRLAREGRINLLERLGNGYPRMVALMSRLVSTGKLRSADPDLLVTQFLGPLLFWRQLYATGSKKALIRNRHAFAKAHVDQFLVGAGSTASADSRARRARIA
jgi:AcrR family transcriptional regulator